MVTAVQPAEYFTTVEPAGCSCKGWRWRRDCRHYRQLRAAQAIIEANRLKWAEVAPMVGNPSTTGA